MEDFLSVLRKGAANAGKGGVLVVAGLAAGLVGAVGLLNNTSLMAGDTQLVLWTTLFQLVPLVVLPFLVGGALGYARELSAGGRPGWDTFFGAARKSYLSLFVAGVVIALVTMLLSYPYALLFLFGDVSLLCLVLPLTLLVMFIVLMSLEFYDIIIVAEGVGFLQGLQRSIAFVRRHLGAVIPFFIIVLLAKLIVQLPLFTAQMMRQVADLAANSSLYFNNTTAGALNASYVNATVALQSQPFSPASLIAIGALQVLVQAIVFAFITSYKAEFYRWTGGYKPEKKITDFDYDFADEKP